MGTPGKPSADDELEDLDSAWDEADSDTDDDEEEADEDEGEDLETVDAGWDAPKRKRSAAEIRKAKARARAEKRRARAAATAQKQKQKKRRQRPQLEQPETEDDASPEDRHALERAVEPRARALPAKKSVRKSVGRDSAKMLAIVAVIVALGALAAWFFSRR